MEECNYCQEKENKVKKYLEEIENEKIRECQKALEREKIARGMRCTRQDEIQLKEQQKMQIEERKFIEKEKQEIEKLWHQVLLDNCHRKDILERLNAKKRQQETLERRKFYDEQISSANKKRQEIIRQEREKENIKLEKIRKKMEQEYFEAIKKKKEQQINNRKNYTEGHTNKLLRLRNEKMKAMEIDHNSVRTALEELDKENERNKIKMKNLQLEKELSIIYYNHEREMASALEEEALRVTNKWNQQEEKRIEEKIRKIEQQQRTRKEKAAEEYQRHIEARNFELVRAKQDRKERMERVKINAFCELQRNINSANEELIKQSEYREKLNKQIKDNNKYLESEIRNIEVKDSTFTRKAQMFKDVMATGLSSSPGRTSTNPVHPFKRVIDSKQPEKYFHLPLI